MKQNKIVYDAKVIIPLNRTTTFNDRLEQQSAYNTIVTNGCTAIMDGEECDKLVTVEDACLPIRVTMDPTGKDVGDDWSISSPIQENDFAPINRWWPKKWFVKQDGTLPKSIQLDLGYVVLNLEVINPDTEVVKATFADTIISQDFNSVTENTNVKGDDMFRRTKPVDVTPEVTPEETKVEQNNDKSDVIIIEPTIEQTKEDNMSENETTTTVEETTTPTTGKKKLSKKLKVGIIATAAAATIGAGVYAFLKIKAIKDGESCDEVVAE